MKVGKDNKRLEKWGGVEIDWDGHTAVSVREPCLAGRCEGERFNGVSGSGPWTQTISSTSRLT